MHSHITMSTAIDEWIIFILRDTKTFAKTKVKLLPLFKKSLKHINDLSRQEERILLRKLAEAVPEAANRYLMNIQKNKNTRFDVYFTWYISEVINAFLEK